VNSDDADKVDLEVNTSVNLPRRRLPPRSRFGCWTCRTRKVKCDEARPECKPCSRLGHTCDYNPRLFFKDDTPRVIERMGLANPRRGSVWDLSGPWPFQPQSMNLQLEDLLPPFSALTNDEDRERKAKFRIAGSYHVIVNPSSFADYEEYKTKEVDGSPHFTPSKEPASAYVDPFSTDQPQDSDPYNSPNDNQASDDPDIVIIKVFQDDKRKMVSPGGGLAVQRRPSRTSTLLIQSSVTSSSCQECSRFSYDNTPFMKMASKDGRDHQLVCYYKNFVHRHLAQVGLPVIFFI